MDNQIKSPLIYIVILNWNNWRDTIACLESVFKIDYPRFRVVVCDNNSSDGSFEKIISWAQGNLSIEIKNDQVFKKLVEPIIGKPISFHIQTPQQNRDKYCDQPLVVIQNGENRGVGPGNNSGFSFALAHGADYIWMLNNDTIVEKNSLSELVATMKMNPRAGLCGTVLMYYHEPQIVQAYGGATFNKFVAYAKSIGAGQTIAQAEQEYKHKHIDYIVGASVLISKKFIDEVGLLSEDYFLYCEEIDWATRAKNKFDLIVAPKSIVYHKEGGTIGGNKIKKSKSPLSLFYSIRSRFIFTRKFYPQYLIFVYLSLYIRLIIHTLRREWDLVKIICKLLIKPFSQAL